MKTLIGGAAAAVLGIIGLAVWWKPFLQLLAGAIPFGLLCGGALAIYLGFDELKDTWKSKEDDFGVSSTNKEDVEKYKQEVEDLKKEVDELKDKKTKK
jgi:cell division protein FtsB